MSQITTKDNLIQLFDDKRQQLSVALPKHIDVDRLIRTVLTELNEKPKLRECTPQSIYNAAIQCAQLGLEPTSQLGHIYLIPYGKRCQAMLGYRGMLELAYRSGKITAISAHVVRDGDEFDVTLGNSEQVHHIPIIGNQAPIIAAYAIATLANGTKQIHVMSKEDIDVHRDQSKSSGKIWQTHYGEMAKKTVIRMLFKYLPISIQLQQWITSEDKAAEGGNMPPPIEGETYLAEEPEATGTEDAIDTGDDYPFA